MAIASSHDEMEMWALERKLFKQQGKELPENLMNEHETDVFLEKKFKEQRERAKGRCLNSPSFDEDRDMTFNSDDKPELDSDGLSIDYEE